MHSLMQLCFLLSLTAVRPLRINPHRREVDEGKPIELTCVSLPGLFSSVSWQKDNKTIPKKYITKVSKTQTSEATLRISEAFLHDAGVYSCVGKLLRGGKMVEMTVVQIKGNQMIYRRVF